MKKLWISIVVAIIVIAAGIWSVKTFVKTKAEGTVMAKILPQNTAMYYSIQNIETIWKNIKASKFWKEFSELSLFKQIQTAGGIDTLKTQFNKNIGIPLTEENIMKLVGTELVIAIIPEAKVSAAPNVLLFCRGKNRQATAELIKPIIDKIQKESPKRIENIKYEKNLITHIKPISKGQPEIYLSLLNNILIIGIGDTQGSIKNVFDISSGKIKKSLADTENFKKLRNLIGNEKKSLAAVFYMDFSKMKKYINAVKLPGPNGSSAQVNTNIDMLKFIEGWTEIKDGLITRLYIYPNTEKLTPQMKKMWEVSPQVPDTLKFVPEKSLLYIVSNSIDLPGIWKLWQKNLKAQAPNQANAVLTAIKNFEKDWGINLENQLFPLIGNEIAFIFSDIKTEGLMPIPKLGFALKITDKNKVDNLISGIIAKNNEKAATEAKKISAVKTATEAANTETPAKGEKTPAVKPVAKTKNAKLANLRFQINLTKHNYEGHNINSLQLPISGIGLAPGYTYLNNFLIVGATTKTLQEIIDVVSGKKQALTYDPSYQEVTALLPKKTNQFSYINTERFMDIGIGISKWIISFQQLNIPQGTPPKEPGKARVFNQRKAQAEATISAINNNIIPLLKTLKAIRIIATSAVNKSDHIEQTMILKVKDI